MLGMKNLAMVSGFPSAHKARPKHSMRIHPVQLATRPAALWKVALGELNKLGVLGGQFPHTRTFGRLFPADLC